MPGRYVCTCCERVSGDKLFDNVLKDGRDEVDADDAYPDNQDSEYCLFGPEPDVKQDRVADEVADGNGLDGWSFLQGVLRVCHKAYR